MTSTIQRRAFWSTNISAPRILRIADELRTMIGALRKMADEAEKVADEQGWDARIDGVDVGHCREAISVLESLSQSREACRMVFALPKKGPGRQSFAAARDHFIALDYELRRALRTLRGERGFASRDLHTLSELWGMTKAAVLKARKRKGCVAWAKAEIQRNTPDNDVEILELGIQHIRWRRDSLKRLGD